MRRLTLVLLALVVAALTTAVIVAQTAKRSPQTAVADVPLDLSALDERVRLGRVGTGAMDSTTVLHPGEGSLVATLDTRRVFLIEASDNRLCVLVVAENSGGASSDCQPPDDLLTAGIVHTSRPPGTVPETVIVVDQTGIPRPPSARRSPPSRRTSLCWKRRPCRSQ